MIPASFDYHAPASLADAIALLQQHGDQAKVLSGGQSLLPLLKLRLGAAGHLVDIGRIPGLEYIKEEGGFLKIGGRTRESLLERSEIITSRYPILHDTALVIADPLVRNRATVGGNLAHARSRERSSGDDARARRRGDRDRSAGRAHDSDRQVLHRHLQHGARCRTKSSPRSASRSRRRGAAART